MRRIVILGTSGAGKSTVARALGDIYRLPHVDLDALTTGTYPPVTGEAFVRRVRDLVASPAWIVDGDYQRSLGDLVLSRAEVAVWLDLPLRTSLARMWRRTAHDVRVGARPFELALTRWVAHEIRSHLRRRFTLHRRLSAHPDLSVVHLRTQREVDAWLATLPVQKVRFFPSERFERQAAVAYADHARRIRERLPGADVRHVGGTSVPGLLTTGDVDLHVRVERDAFAAARDALRDLYEPLYEDRWRESAYFFDPRSEPRVEVALTEIGNIDDLHHGEAWRRIARDPALIERYNDLKRACEGRPAEEYDAAERNFFYSNFRL
jgi:adenylate kinase family enzyme/GrpB-like predicted nucleotidyltransferase (UPF0157 family)